ncbi:uncharacterized protein CbrC (UPF0167 family) [Metapseudomonas resinovorans]|uniref:hypothetical protein n=1 Tax=Metapseudomonas resinovorans TaxID=53412 RepID=UPI003D1E3D11
MNNQAPIGRPERTPEYRSGADYRRRNLSINACPWGNSDMLKQSLWKAGYHDMDMAMSEGGSQ